MQGLRRGSRDDCLRQAGDDGLSLTVKFAGKHGIVFRASRENLRDAANLIPVAGDRIELTLTSKLCQVFSVAGERRVVRFIESVASRITLAAQRGGIMSNSSDRF